LDARYGLQVKMNDKKTIEETIIEDIQKTGYPTEITAASIMQANGWSVVHNPSFWDQEEQKSREIDIQAYRQWPTQSKNWTMGVYLIAECKKSEKPWVFFTKDEKYEHSRLGSLIYSRIKGTPLFTSYDQESALIPDKDLLSSHHYFRFERQARTFYEPLKNQDKAAHSAMIYSAVMSAIKATLFRWADASYEKWIGIYYPVIILAGDLFEARIGPGKTISLAKTNHVQLSFHYMQPDPRINSKLSHRQFTIDVVREDHLAQFLKLVEDEHQVIAGNI